MSNKLNKRRGLMLVLSSPSGAGKTTLSRKLLEGDDEIDLSISVTTRAPRPGEVDGVDYIFVPQSEFDRMVDASELLEYATVFGNSYGTPKGAVKEALDQGRDILFDIDWQGTQQLKHAAQTDIVSIFILPPSIAALKDRLKGRAQDSAGVVEQRMAGAKSEIKHWDEYDFVLVNSDLNVCLDEIRAILTSERNRNKRRLDLVDFTKSLMED
jgi:guanylate kinase